MVREAGLAGMFRHMNTQAEANKMDMIWAAAIAHAGLPPNIVENEYIRDAVLQTSMMPAPYSLAHRTKFETKLIPSVDQQLSVSLRDILRSAVARTLQFDGWEELINMILSSPEGDEFLYDIDMHGKEKTSDALAGIALDALKAAQARYGYTEGTSTTLANPTTFAIVTDNPTPMRAARNLIKVGSKADKELYQPFLFDYPCFLHCISSLLGDMEKQPFIKRNFDAHKLIVRKVRKRPWLRQKLLDQQQARRVEFLDKAGRFRPLTVKRHGETRIGSVPLSAARNIKLRYCLDGVASLPEYNTKCGIKKSSSAPVSASVSAAAAQASSSSGVTLSINELVRELDEAEEIDSDQSEDETEASTKAKKEKEKKEKSSNDCARVKELVRNETFWSESDEVQRIVKPVSVALKYADRRESLMGFVWPIMFKIQQTFEAVATGPYEGAMPLAEREACLQAVKDRWVYLHSPLHSLAYVLNPRFVGMDHFGDDEVRVDCEALLTELLPSIQDVSDALSEYHEYHDKKGRFAGKPLLWFRVSVVSPADWWAKEAPRLKWLNSIATRVLSLQHSAGGAERNWSSHGFINSDLRKTQKSMTLDRLVRLYRNMRLRDRVLGRGIKARKEAAKEPKSYPLEGSSWSSCDESEDDHEAVQTAAKEFNLNLPQSTDEEKELPPSAAMSRLSMQ